MRRRGHHSPYPKVNNAPLSEAAGLIRTFNTETNPARPARPSPLAKSSIPDMPLDMLDKIRSFPLFQSAPEAFLIAIGAHLRPQSHSPHDYIITEGDEGKAMYWLYRGSVAVTSRDGESTFFELKPGAFFGEIGILMSIPRTATIIARTKCLIVQLKKEDLFTILPQFPDVERAIREEASERLAILNSKKKEIRSLSRSNSSVSRGGKRAFEEEDEIDMIMSDKPRVRHYSFSNNKKRKSPSPGLVEAAASSALGTGQVHIRQILKELPLFAKLPSEILHFLGSNAEQRTYPPFTDIIKQGSQGREVFFIIRGEVEVLDETAHQQDLGTHRYASMKRLSPTPKRKARLKQGNYFGEVASLALAPRRTATVRSITLVECLLITGEIIAEFWKRCPPDIRERVEQTAKERLSSTQVNDVVMKDVMDPTSAIDSLVIQDRGSKSRGTQITPRVVFNEGIFGGPKTHKKSSFKHEPAIKENVDPDPFLMPDLDNVRARSRRSSLAPISPDPSAETDKPLLSKLKHASAPPEPAIQKRSSAAPRSSSIHPKGMLPTDILITIFSHLALHELMQLRPVSRKWDRIVRESPHLVQYLDLSSYNRKVNDTTVRDYIAPFAGSRPTSINISNCFHLSDEGFTTLASICGSNVTTWKMKSVWEVSAVAIHEMVKSAPKLSNIDLSNCRKVNDALLMHVVGNIPLTIQHNSHGSPAGNVGQFSQFRHHQPRPVVPTNSVNLITGAQNLRKLKLSYCKHVTDRSMAHIGAFARTRLEEVDLTRCTTITDHGFEAWGQFRFPRLTRLCLADCTYLTDNAIVSLTHAAPALRYLDLVSRLFQLE